MRVQLALLIGILLASGCQKTSGTVLGKAPKGDSQTVLAVRAGTTSPNVTLNGLIIEKCPVAGCWFRLRDRTGIIKVDTKSAGFVVIDIPLQSRVTVSGKVVAQGDEVEIDATGLRY